MRIAIVDDLIAERERLTQMLTAELHATHTEIHKLDTFDSAESFLEKWTLDAYDLILLDIYMGGATGVEAARKIRETDENVHLVFCTTSNEFASESYALGISYYLHKPYSADDLRRMIRKVRPADSEIKTRINTVISSAASTNAAIYLSTVSSLASVATTIVAVLNMRRK